MVFSDDCKGPHIDTFQALKGESFGLLNIFFIRVGGGGGLDAARWQENNS